MSPSFWDDDAGLGDCFFVDNVIVTYN